MNKATILRQRLIDSRSRKVVFLSHCLLNENTRYLGGACRAACVREIVERCVESDFGMVQMPCPEQLGWGGVTKRLLLLAYGSKGALIHRFRGLILPIFLFYTKQVYGKLAREIADQIKDYVISGFSVVGVIGVDGSPSCGVGTTLDFGRSFDLTAGLDIGSITVDRMNAIIRQCRVDGRGLFTAALQRELKRRDVAVPYLAHDLFAELDGKTSDVAIHYQD